MMTILTTIVVAFVAATAFIQGLYTALYTRFMRGSSNRKERAPEQSPPVNVAVVLCLRGIDPALENCLAALSRQSYRKFTLHIVFDDKLDPAVESARWFAEQSRLDPRFHYVDHSKFGAGGLKCHALVTAIENGAGDAEFVALIDADSVVDENWLKDLIAPFADESVGATTGNRWFEPAEASAGSLMRKIWSAAAVVQMYIYNIAWGGSLAVRTTTLMESGLLEKWRTAFCEDTMLSSALGEHGLKLIRVPDLIAVNRETTSLRDTYRWIVRQLLTVRLYHRGWRLVLLHGLAMGVCLITVPVLLVVAALTQQWTPFAALLATAILFPVVNSLIILVVNRNNRTIVSRRFSDGAQARTHSNRVKYFLMIMVTQFVQPVAALRAATMRRVSWRGVEYRIRGNEVKMTKYLSFKDHHKRLEPNGHSVH